MFDKGEVSMKRKRGILITLVLALMFLLVGCGNKQSLNDKLIEGNGRWELSTPNGTGSVEFFEGGKATLYSDDDSEKMTYTVNKEQDQITMKMTDYEDVKTTIKNIVIEDDKTIKGDLYQNDDDESSPVKMVK